MADFLQAVDSDAGPKEPTPVTIVHQGKAGQGGSAWVDVSVASLTADQAAGTVAILAENLSRKGLMINPPTDCILAIGSGETSGWPLFTEVPNSIMAPEVPTNTLYVSGLAENAALVIWEA